MDTAMTRAEHEEFRRRMEDEHERQNRRIELLEESTERLNTLSVSIEKLATNMENMVKEQVKQGNRLEVLENRDGEMWRKVVAFAITSVLGIVIGYAFARLGFKGGV
jgi:anti-sigma-K factor RskA